MQRKPWLCTAHCWHPLAALADLDIEAVCISSSDDHILYQFSLHAAGRLLLDGRAAVVVNADSIVPVPHTGDTP
jgi:hypothetical protein